MTAMLPLNVQRFLANADEKTKALHLALEHHGLRRTYEKYLKDADWQVLTNFFADLSRADLEWVGRHRKALLSPIVAVEAEYLEPVAPATISPDLEDQYKDLGLRSLQDGQWAVVVLAGGSATRFYEEPIEERIRKKIEHLGQTPPKALFPIGPVSEQSFLEIFTSEIFAIGMEAGRLPYLILLVSDVTASPIRSWLASADLWGFPKDLFLLLKQAVHPRLDMEGDLVVMPDGHLSWSGDGHGGTFKALLKPDTAGITPTALLRSSGVRHLVLHNVDNAAAKALHLQRLGFHVSKEAHMTISVAPRQRLDEKVGLVLFNRASNRIEVIEYSVCPREVASAASLDGRPLFNLAHICTNLVSLDAVRADLPPTLYTGKKIKVGEKVIESSTFEMLVQDLSRLLDPSRVQVLLLERDEFFLPTKTLRGPDSVESTVAGICREHRKLLETSGAQVADDALVEVAAWAQDIFRRSPSSGWKIGHGSKVFLGVRFGLCDQPLPRDLRVENDATFSVMATRPYGNIRFQYSSRHVEPDPSTAGRLYLGNNVTFASGSCLRVVLEQNAALVIRDSTTWSGCLEARIPSGEQWIIEKDGELSRHKISD